MPYRTRSYLTVLIVGGIIISLCMGVRQSLGLFMGPITRDIGVTAGAFGFSIALQNIVWGFTQPVVGAIADTRRNRGHADSTRHDRGKNSSRCRCRCHDMVGAIRAGASRGPSATRVRGEG